MEKGAWRPWGLIKLLFITITLRCYDGRTRSSTAHCAGTATARQNGRWNEAWHLLAENRRPGRVDVVAVTYVVRGVRSFDQWRRRYARSRTVPTRMVSRQTCSVPDDESRQGRTRAYPALACEGPKAPRPPRACGEWLRVVISSVQLIIRSASLGSIICSPSGVWSRTPPQNGFCARLVVKNS